MENQIKKIIKKRFTKKKIQMSSVLNKRGMGQISVFDLLPVPASEIAEQLTSLEVLFLQSIRYFFYYFLLFFLFFIEIYIYIYIYFYFVKFFSYFSIFFDIII